MNYSYLIKHWLSTLIFAPFLWMIYVFFFENARAVRQLFEIYPTIIIYSFVFSLPTLITYFFMYRYLISNNSNKYYAKSFLITWAVVGITLSYFVLFKHKIGFLLSYSIATIISGLLCKINMEQTEK